MKNDTWTTTDAALAERLLNHVAGCAAEQRSQDGLRTDHAAWPWPDAAEPPVDAVLTQAVDREVAAGETMTEDALRVACRLREGRQRPGLLEAMGCLIPRDLHPKLDGVKPKGKATPGATTTGAVLTFGAMEAQR